MTSIALPKNPIIVPLSKPFVATAATPKGIRLTCGDYVLRSLSPADVTEHFLAWFNAAELQSGPRISRQDFSLTALRSFVAQFDNHRNYFLGIFHGEQLLGFYVIDVNLPHRIANVAVGISHEAHPQLLSATMPALFDVFAAHRNIEKFTARVLADNKAILAKFMEVDHLVLEAELKQDWLASNGTRVDLLVFAAYKQGSRIEAASKA